MLLQGSGLLTDLTSARTLRCRCAACRPAEGSAPSGGNELHAVGLRAAADLYPRELSGGMADGSLARALRSIRR